MSGSLIRDWAFTLVGIGLIVGSLYDVAPVAGCFILGVFCLLIGLWSRNGPTDTNLSGD